MPNGRPPVLGRPSRGGGRPCLAAAALALLAAVSLLGPGEILAALSRAADGGATRGVERRRRPLIKGIRSPVGVRRGDDGDNSTGAGDERSDYVASLLDTLDSREAGRGEGAAEARPPRDASREGIGGGGGQVDRPAICDRIGAALDVTRWPDVVYHKDRRPHPDDRRSDRMDLEDDDRQARSTVAEFNRLRRSVLTGRLLDSGFGLGRLHAARRLARRMTGVNSTASARRRPIQIAVFGNSFTIGSNCGESTVQPSEGERGCAWPSRLERRWDEVFGADGPFFNLTEVNAGADWRMYQENAQGSVNIAQKLPSVVDEYRTKGADPDVILLDNTITDAFYVGKPWFEAVVRALLETFPDAVIVCLRDAKNDLAESFPDYVEVVRHYGLAHVDFVKMVDTLRYSREEPYAGLRQEYPGKDLLWPQVQGMVASNGSACGDGEPACPYSYGVPCYWQDFLPLVEKTKCAYYPNNHPPWPTHQYVADSVMYALLRTIEYGSGCVDGGNEMPSSPAGVPEDTVADGESLAGCFICRRPVDEIDARSYDTSSVAANANATDDGGVLEGRDEPIWRWHSTDGVRAVLVCGGDWRWTTDEQRRSGWRSDEANSTIRFRVRVDGPPTLSVTYMRSHEKFGDLVVTLRAVVRGGAERDRSCDPGAVRDVAGALPTWDPNYDRKRTVTLSGHRESHSLWDAAVFPAADEDDVNSMHLHELLRETVLTRMEEEDVGYVDVYVHNLKGDRIKIQSVTSC